MVIYVIGTNSVHMSAEVCDYLSRHIDAGDTIRAAGLHPSGDGTDSEDVRDGGNTLNVVASRLGDLADVETHQYTRGNDVVDGALQYADGHDADEIVVDIQGYNPTSGIVFGSTVQDVLLHSNTPVVVAPLETI